MKKLSLLFSILVMFAILAFAVISCKKPVHSLAPTPNNVRLLGYTATTQHFGTIIDTTNDNYTFFYDGNNRVIRIIYSTSDTAKIRAQAKQTSVNITFNYFSDTCIKTTAALGGTPVIEIDTFVINQNTNLITNTFVPGLASTYQYYGKLLSQQSNTYSNNYHGVTTVSDSWIYNSDDGNFLNYTFNNILTVNFPHTMTFSPYPMRDYWVQIPGLNTVAPNLSDVTFPGLNYTTHAGLASYQDQLTYNIGGIPLLIYAVDTAKDTCYVDFPGNIWTNQTYTFYTTEANRVGDYLWLGSFTQWGSNLYQNANLVHTITNSGYTTNVTYNIDSYNKITQLKATIVDSLGETNTVNYNLQYETF